MADEQAVPETSPTPPEQPQPAAPEQAPADAPTTTEPAPQPVNPDAPAPDQPQQDPAAPAVEAEQRAHEAFVEAHEQGYFGTNVDPRPNSDYSLESGPHAPSQLEQLRDAAQAQVDQLDELVDLNQAANQSQEG